MGLYRTIRKIARRRRQRRRLVDLLTIESIRSEQRDFERVVEEIRASGTDSLSHFQNGYTHEGGLFLQQNPDEFAALCLLLSRYEPLRSYLEIGSASGGACLFLYRRLRFERVLCMDDGRHPRASAQDHHLGQIPNCHRFLGDSHSDAARRFLQQNVDGNGVDLAFIDGDHSYEGVVQDVELTLDFCRPRSLMVFHDTVACEGVERAWVEMAESRRLKPVAEFVGQTRPLGIGVAEVLINP